MSEYIDQQSVKSTFIILIALLGIGLILLGILTIPHLLKGEKQVCEKEYETVCYKVGCSGFGCSEAEVDCNSNNVDRTRREVKKEVCKWVKKDFGNSMEDGKK